MGRVRWLWSKYREVLRKLSFLPQFNTDDFTVEYQSTLVADLPKATLGGRAVPDLSLLAPDCFHFMKELHSRIGRNLWNNLLQPAHHRTVEFNKTQNLSVLLLLCHIL